MRLYELLKRWQGLAEDAIPPTVEWIFERAELKEETAKALQPLTPDEHYTLAQQIAELITPIVMRFDVYPAGAMRDEIAYAVASFMLREGFRK